MESNKGITLISLVSSVILILILASVTVVTSMSSYNQMKFEGAKAEIEQVEKLVDEIASDYQTYLNEKEGTSGLSYSTFFQARYNISSTDISGKLLSANQEKAQTIMGKYTEISIPSDTMFYFSQDDLDKYFDLKGINDVVIDFATRNVYSVEGIKDPDDKDHLYYVSTEWGSDTKVAHNDGTTTATVAAASSSNHTINGIKYADITLTITGNFKVSEIYAIVPNTSKKLKVDQYNKNDKVIYFSIPVTETGNYQFEVYDDSKNVIKSSNLSLTK